MQNLLLQLDTSIHPSVFDRVVGFDGGAEQVLSYGGVTPDTVRDLVHGAIFTRGPKDLHRTAIFVGGSDMGAGERLLEAVLKSFVGPMQTSVMLDANGSNTTAAAAVLRLEQAVGDLRQQRAVVLAGSGPVGLRAAGLLARAGAEVTVTTRRPADGALAERITWRFGGTVHERLVQTPDDTAAAVRDATLILNAGPAGVCLLNEAGWRGLPALRAIADLNAVPPLGIEGVAVTDNAEASDGVIRFGALGVGSLKMKIHKACIARLFERNDLVLDAETIASIGRELTASKR